MISLFIQECADKAMLTYNSYKTSGPVAQHWGQTRASIQFQLRQKKLEPNTPYFKRQYSLCHLGSQFQRCFGRYHASEGTELCL